MTILYTFTLIFLFLYIYSCMALELITKSTWRDELECTNKGYAVFPSQTERNDSWRVLLRRASDHQGMIYCAKKMRGFIFVRTLGVIMYRPKFGVLGLQQRSKFSHRVARNGKRRVTKRIFPGGVK